MTLLIFLLYYIDQLLYFYKKEYKHVYNVKTDANISENKNNILITLLASICSLGPLATDMYLPALPQMTLDFSTTPSIIQLTLHILAYWSCP